MTVPDPPVAVRSIACAHVPQRALARNRVLVNAVFCLSLGFVPYPHRLLARGKTGRARASGASAFGFWCLVCGAPAMALRGGGVNSSESEGGGEEEDK